MQLLRTCDVKLKNIKLPGDWKKHLDPTVVAEMARTLESGGVLPPVVLDIGHKLHAGRNRYAAHKEAGLDTIRADVIDFADVEEAEELELKENLHRKVLDADGEAKATARLVELTTHRIERERAAEEAASCNSVANSPAASKPGPRKSAKAEAVGRVAAATGLSRQGVQKRMERAEKPPEAPAPALTFEAWGLQGMNGFGILADQAAALQKAMDTVSAACARAVGALAEVEQLPAVLGWPALHQLKEEAHRIGRVARALRPEAICPFCKGVLDGCPSCGGRELVGAGELERAPDELKLGGDQAMVCVGPDKIVKLEEGRGCTYGEARGVHGPKKGSKKVKVLLPDGQPFEEPSAPSPDPEPIDDADIPF